MLKWNKVLFFCFLAFSVARASLVGEAFRGLFSRDTQLTEKQKQLVESYEKQLASQRRQSSHVAPRNVSSPQQSKKQPASLKPGDQGYIELLLGTGDPAHDTFNYFEQKLKEALIEYNLQRGDTTEEEKNVKRAILNEVIWSVIAYYRNKDSMLVALKKKPRETAVLYDGNFEKQYGSIPYFLIGFYNDSFSYFKEFLSPKVLETFLRNPNDTKNIGSYIALCERYIEYMTFSIFSRYSLKEINGILGDLTVFLSSAHIKVADNPLYTRIVMQLKNIIKSGVPKQWLKANNLTTLQEYLKKHDLNAILDVQDNALINSFNDYEGQVEGPEPVKAPEPVKTPESVTTPEYIPESVKVLEKLSKKPAAPKKPLKVDAIQKYIKSSKEGETHA